MVIPLSLSSVGYGELGRALETCYLELVLAMILSCTEL